VEKSQLDYLIMLFDIDLSDKLTEIFAEPHLDLTFLKSLPENRYYSKKNMKNKLTYYLLCCTTAILSWQDYSRS
jgi:hypothetical protein